MQGLNQRRYRHPATLHNPDPRITNLPTPRPIPPPLPRKSRREPSLHRIQMTSREFGNEFQRNRFPGAAKFDPHVTRFEHDLVIRGAVGPYGDDVV